MGKSKMYTVYAKLEFKDGVLDGCVGVKAVSVEESKIVAKQKLSEIWGKNKNLLSITVL